MCVILQCDKENPTPTLDMLKEAQETNPHGGGIAYNLGDGYTHVEKGMHVTAEYVHELIKKHNLKNKDFIVHFRIATHGAVNDKLCHPFIVSKTGKNMTKFKTKGSVLFHNGVWNEYDDYAVKLAFTRNLKIPDGDISDSSMMAWISSHVGINFLGMIDEKITIINPKGITRFGSGWTEVDNIICSNDLFDNKFTFGGYQDNFTFKTKKGKKSKDKDDEEPSLNNDSIFYNEMYDEMNNNLGFYNQDELDYLDNR